MKRVLVADKIAEEGIEKLRREADVDFLPDLKEEELISCIDEYDALIVRSKTMVTRRIIEAGERLRVIGRAGVGVDNIDVEAATEEGILVVNAPEGSTISAAEHTIAMMMALSRKIPQADSSLRSRRWEKNRYTGVEVWGKTLGVIGLGRIGTEVVRRANGLGMNVIAYDPFVSQDKAEEIGIELSTMEEVLKRADYITVHTPLTEETRHLIGPKVFDLMKDGVRIINCARGGIIDDDALADAIKGGKVAGAALDVFEKEPPYESPLLNLENVIITPHMGASTEEAQHSVAMMIVDEILRAIREEPVKNAINMPSIKPEVFGAIKPHLGLAEKLGRFCVQLIDGHIKSVEVGYHGEIAKKETELITMAVLKGMLSLFVSGANLINASLLVKGRGIRIMESKTEYVESFSSLISVCVNTDEGKKEVAGTLFGKDDARIVRIDDYRIDAVPSGYMLISSYTDKPKVIGPVGVILGENGINIAGMQVGRREIGGEAVMVLNIDNPVSEDVLDEIRKVDGVIDLKSIML
jgi:D-3-phosphoglycerate dehydrogenase